MKHINTTLRNITLALGLTGSVLSLSVVAQPPSAITPAVQQQSACACFEATVVGQGPAVILIPGLASSGEVWQSTVAALKNDYQFHILTLAGFAGVKPLPAKAWGAGYLPTQQQAILHYIAEQQLDRPVIIGHSLGGYLALALAANTPDKIAGAVNVDGLPALGALFAQAAAQQNEAQSPSSFDPLALAKSMARDEQWQQRIVADMFRSDGMTSGRVMGELMQADLRPQLGDIRVPVLTLGALQYGAPYSTPEQVQRNYENQLANAPAQYHGFAFARESKHFIMADEPVWLQQQLQQFLTQHLKQD